MMQKFKILVTRKWPKKVEENLLTTFDTTLNVEDKPLSESELIEAMRSYDALLPTVTDPITDKIISTPDRRVKIIGNFGVGFNNIDIDSAKNKGYKRPRLLSFWRNSLLLFFGFLHAFLYSFHS